MTPFMTIGAPMPALSIKVAYTGTAGTTTALNANATAVRVLATTDCFIEITTAGTAAVADTGLYLLANSAEYFSIPVNAKISAIQVASAGTLYVTPMA